VAQIYDRLAEIRREARGELEATIYRNAEALFRWAEDQDP